MVARHQRRGEATEVMVEAMGLHRAADTGQNNTGGGGGGGCCTGTAGVAGVNGGSGTVLIKTTWRNVTTTGTVIKTELETGETIYKWNNTGSITFNQ